MNDIIINWEQRQENDLVKNFIKEQYLKRYSVNNVIDSQIVNIQDLGQCVAIGVISEDEQSEFTQFFYYEDNISGTDFSRGTL